MGLATLGLALAHTPLQMYVLAVVTGLAQAFTNMGIGVIFQKRIAPEYFGRVGSLLGMVGIIGMPLTLLVLAPIADRIAISTIFTVSGTLAVLGALAWAAILKREPITAPTPAHTTAVWRTSIRCPIFALRADVKHVLRQPRLLRRLSGEHAIHESRSGENRSPSVYGVPSWPFSTLFSCSQFVNSVRRCSASLACS